MGNEPWWKHLSFRLNAYRDKALIDDLSRFQGRGQRSERVRELMRKGLEAEQRGLLSASPYQQHQPQPTPLPSDNSMLIQLLLQLIQQTPQNRGQQQQLGSIDLLQLIQQVQQATAQQPQIQKESPSSESATEEVTEPKRKPKDEPEPAPAPEPEPILEPEPDPEPVLEPEPEPEPDPEPEKPQVQIKTKPARPVVRRTPRFTRSSEEDNKSPEERKKETLLRNMGGSFDNLDF